MSKSAQRRSPIRQIENMFTLAQIREAHARVKSGADFPAYIREIRKLGVSGYETWVYDGHNTYFGNEGFTLSSPPLFPSMPVAPKVDRDQFIKILKLHQQGGSDYPTFCRQCGETGIERWVVNIINMTCTYFDKSGEPILIEDIPH
jgi:uncharacterized protein YbcV (DUF1398 family)